MKSHIVLKKPSCQGAKIRCMLYLPLRKRNLVFSLFISEVHSMTKNTVYGIFVFFWKTFSF